MEAQNLSDDELLRREPIARIRAWDAKKGDYARAGAEWCSLQGECVRRGLASSTTWPDFWPRSPRAKEMRLALGMREPDFQNSTES